VQPNISGKFTRRETINPHQITVRAAGSASLMCSGEMCCQRRKYFMGILGTNLFDLLFGCWHRNLSFPQSPSRRQRQSVTSFETGTYVVCLDCGKEFAYDWQKMRVLTGKRKPNLPSPLKLRTPKAASIR
jgi:hypothetical protein